MLVVEEFTVHSFHCVQLSSALLCIPMCTCVRILQVVSQYSNELAPLSVDAVLKVIDPATATNVDLRDIKIIKKLG